MHRDPDEEAARLRLWQNSSLAGDLDLDAVAARHSDDDEVLTLVDLARESRRLVVLLAMARHRQQPRPVSYRRRA